MQLRRTLFAGLFALSLCVITNASGQSGTSVNLFTFTNSWRYNQTSSYDGVNWTSPQFDDSSLPTGRGVLAVEDGNNQFVLSRRNTTLTIGRLTYYFRTQFVFTNDPALASLTFSNIVDDGAVFYLNGVEVRRLFLNPGTVNYSTLAQSHEATGVDVFTLSGPVVTTNLVRGTNVLAVEVHQSDAGSSDIVFGSALTAFLRDTNPPATLRMPNELPAYGFTLTNGFPGLTFSAPIAIATPPGETNRIFIAERGGRVSIITNLAVPNRTVFLDIASRVSLGCEEGLLGLAFHPNYAVNGQFFVFYSTSTTTPAGSGLHQRVSRFQVDPANPNRALTNEVILLTQYDQACNHNGGDIHFGPDGYLYVALGDEGNQNDSFNNSQTIRKDFFSGIIRIDPDMRAGNLWPNPHPALAFGTNYLVPADNPWITNSFVGELNPGGVLRTEFYAVGMRNPWRFSFDPETGLLWCGDVGGSAREEVDIVVKGGNYGWAFREGFTTGPKANSGATVLNPIHDYPHGSTGTNVGNSITGGIVYRGTRLPELNGAYVFADYTAPGNVWALRYDGTNSRVQWLLQDQGIAAFGRDPRNGDVLAVDIGDGMLKRLSYDTNSSVGTPLPPTLADTGAFTNLTSLTNVTQPLTINSGGQAYDINHPFWSDGAHKTRWFFMPTNSARIGFAAETNWSLPSGMAWVKHFDLEITNGEPESVRRLETRILVRNSNGIYGVTYRWDSLTNASLVGDAGLNETIVRYDGSNVRTQVWRYPSRSECAGCHTPAGGFALGFNTLQLNRQFNGTNQLAAMNASGLFTTNLTDIHWLRALAAISDESASREWRVRSYLAANCAQCHVPGGPALGSWSAAITNPTALAGLINGPVVNNGGNPDARVIAPGSISNSLLLARISMRGPGQMPPIGSTVVDTGAVALLSAWITNDLAAGWSNGTANTWLEIRPTNNSPALVFTQPANRAQRIEFTTNLLPPVVWQFLEAPENQPRYPASNTTTVVTDPNADSEQRFYRLRLSAP
jgi:glucose/arabinose dehydrogenase/mono/diheme cytochrome c family protein